MQGRPERRELSRRRNLEAQQCLRRLRKVRYQIVEESFILKFLSQWRFLMQ
jgi:hypothetical protein